MLDSKTHGWYVVPGIPTAPRTALDPLDAQFDPEVPDKPVCVGKCLLEELNERERFETMRSKLNKGLQDVKTNGDVIRKKVSKEHQSYLDALADNMRIEGEFQTVMIQSLGSSRVAMEHLAQSDEAMAHLAHSDEAMKWLARSDEAVKKLAQSDDAMRKLAQSDDAMRKLAQSDDAMRKLAQSDDAMLKILGPEMFRIWKEHQRKSAK